MFSPRLFCVVFLTTGCAQHTPATMVPSLGDVGTLEELDVPYDGPAGEDPSQFTMDVTWRPDGGSKRAVVLVHGGSWVGGDKANFREHAPALIEWFLERGYVTVAPDFRLATPLGEEGSVTPREQVEDLARALAWVDGHGADWGITESRPLLLGFSSGAHLVALLGADPRPLTSLELPEDHVYATLSFDVHAYDVPDTLELMEGSVVEHNIPLIEHLFGTTATEQLDLSPAHHLDTRVAPALLIGAEPDPSEPGSKGWVVSQASERYVDALAGAGYTGAFHHFQDKSHSGLMMGFGYPGDGPTAAVQDFLAELAADLR